MQTLTDTRRLISIGLNMGTLAAGKISVGSMTISADNETITMGNASAPTTGTGVFIGKDGTVYQFRVGDPAGDHILWDGSTFTYPSAIENPPSIKSAGLFVQDNGTDEVYSSDWTISDAVTTSYNVRIRYYKEGVRAGTNTVTATNLSDTFTNTGAGGSTAGNEDMHHADFQLLDSGGNVVGGLLEHPETVEAI